MITVQFNLSERKTPLWKSYRESKELGLTLLQPAGGLAELSVLLRESCSKKKILDYFADASTAG